MKSGIYKLTNVINNKIYIGSTCSFKDRKSKHKNRKNNTMISRAIFKYGWENFTFEILEYCEKDKLIEREKYYFDLLKPFKENNGYNILRNPIKNGWINASHSEESKKKMSESKKGIIPWNKGKKGVQICSDETRQLYSDQRRGENNSFYGKTHSEETKKKISRRNKGSDHSYEYKSVVQIDKNTFEVIKIWDSISDVYKFFNVINFSNISKVCNGKQKTAFGFIWKYHNI